MSANAVQKSKTVNGITIELERFEDRDNVCGGKWVYFVHDDLVTLGPFCRKAEAKKKFNAVVRDNQHGF